MIINYFIDKIFKMNTLRKNTNIKWSPSSWKNFKISQQPAYPDPVKVEAIKSKLSTLPHLVNYKEVELLKSKLTKCHERESFIIQVGDCAETFKDANEETIQRKLIFFNLLSDILCYHLKKEIIIIGRIGGQYAKPRSSDFEMISGSKVEVFRGEIVNDISPSNRTPDPERLSKAYYNSAVTMNQILNWNVYADKSINSFKKIISEDIYSIQAEKFVNKLLGYYDEMELIQSQNEKPNRDSLVFTSHEGLLLNYEECFVKRVDNNHFDLSSHFLWIGERTGSMEEAHVEFFRGISNPIGIKTSARTNLESLVEIIKLLNPNNEKGKIVVITRFGTDIAESCLDSLCETIKEAALNVLFVCDPNHGNTKLDPESKKKVRHFEELKEEILITNRVLTKHGLFLSGIHLEASAFNVTECIGGLENKISQIKEELYTTYCDPRLNMLQTMELCDLVGNYITHEEDIEDCLSGSNGTSTNSIENDHLIINGSDVNESKGNSEEK